MPSLRERAPGVWTLRVSNGVDPVDGRRRVVTETFRGSKRAATARLAELQTEVYKGSRQNRTRTLRQAIVAWRAEAAHEKGTARNYDLAVKSIPAQILKTPVDRVTAEVVRELVKRVHTADGVSRARLVHAVISGGLTHAWRNEWTAGNVARRVKPPAQPDRADTTPTAVEVVRLLELVADNPEWYAWILLSAVLGARPQEVFALRWSDINLDRGEVAITKAIDRIDGTVKSTKTRKIRTVAIGPGTCAALQRWHDAFCSRGIRPVADPYVFPGDLTGSTPWRLDLSTKRYARLRTKAKVGGRLYDLRHTSATQLLNAGVPLKVVGDRLGHTRLATTSDIYGSTLPASDREAAELIERLLSPVVGTPVPHGEIASPSV